MESGFVVPGDAKALARISGQNKDLFIATQNRDSLKVYEKSHYEGSAIKFKPEPTDTWAELLYESGKKEKVEFYHGAGYLTQSSRTIIIPDDVVKVIIYRHDGSSREIEVNSLMVRE